MNSMFPFSKQQKKDEIKDIAISHLCRRAIEPFENSENSTFSLERNDPNNSVKGGGQHARQRSAYDLQGYLLNSKMEDSPGMGNLVSFGAKKSDFNSHEEQYISLKAFLAASNSTYRRELMDLVFPVFTLLIVDLVSKGSWLNAQAFFTKYSHDHEDSHGGDLEQLSKLVNTKELHSEERIIIEEIKHKKFKLLLSSKVFGYLLQHLRNNNHSLLLQMINKSIEIKTVDNSGPRPEEEELEINSGFTDANLKEANAEFRSGLSNGYDYVVQDLEDVISKLNFTRTIKPSICLYSFVNAFQGLSAVKFSSNGNFLCAGFEDSSVRLWSLTMKKLVAPRYKMEPNGVRAASSDGSSGECIVMRGHKGPVYSVSFLQEGGAILSASEDTSVRLWSVQSQTSMVEYKGHSYPVWDISTGPKGSYFVSASQDQTVRLWATEYAFPLRILAGHIRSVDSVLFHPNGNYVASGSTDKTCRLWDLQSGQFVRVFVGHQAPIYSLTFSPDGNYLVSGGDDNQLFIWDIRTGKCLKELKGHTETCYALAFSKDRTMLASGGLDHCVKVWDGGSIVKYGTNENEEFMQHGELIGTYPTRSTNVLDLQFTQGNLLLCGGLQETK